jgi:hypothetical protein
VTLRICLIGDSHIAALQYALMENADPYQAARVFLFATRGKGLGDLEYENGAIMSRDVQVSKSLARTGGSDRIVLDDYDAFCVVGGQGRTPLVGKVCEKFSTADMAIAGSVPVSSALLDDLFRDVLQTTLAYKVVSLLRSHTEKPIFYVGNPFVSHAVLGDTEQGEFFRAAIEAKAAEKVVQHFRNGLEAAIGAHAQIIAQPPETITDVMFTQADYGKGSRRLSQAGREHPDDDFNHMNESFGRLVLDGIVERIVSSLR